MKPWQVITIASASALLSWAVLSLSGISFWGLGWMLFAYAALAAVFVSITTFAVIRATRNRRKD